MSQLEQSGLADETGRHSAFVAAAAKGDGFIAVIESRMFLRECIRRNMQSAFSLPVVTCSTLSELELKLKDASAAIVILSWMEASNEANTNALQSLSELVPRVPVIVLADKNDVDLARTAIRHGAKGYISCTLGVDITVEAVRFVLAGGTYVPMECVLATGPGVLASPASRPSGGVTAPEVAVIRALQQGKSNKVIAYELNMCESTVKVHIRNIMRKLKAKNRTDVAIKARTVLSLTPSVGAHLEFSAPNNLGLLKSSDKNDNPAIGVLTEPLHQPVEPAGRPGACGRARDPGSTA
jgi:DNA-binding NarL/FixJ family response regulator